MVSSKVKSSTKMDKVFNKVPDWQLSFETATTNSLAPGLNEAASIKPVNSLPSPVKVCKVSAPCKMAYLASCCVTTLNCACVSDGQIDVPVTLLSKVKAVGIMI